MRLLPAILALAVPLLGACTGAEPGTPPGPAAPPRPAPVVATRVTADAVASARWLRSDLPRSVPATDSDVPSLLDDLPGRAVMTYHPPEIYHGGPSGWSSEDVYFFGADGRWRVLRMEDLGLPESAWVADTYGPGALSGDGRTWAAFSSEGPIVLDLGSGDLVPTDVGTYTSPPKWVPGEQAIVTQRFTGPRGRSVPLKISTVDGSVTRPPYVPWQVGFQPDGTPVSLHRVDARTEEMVAWRGSTTEPLATVTGPRVAPRSVARRSAALVSEDRLVRVARPHRADVVEVIEIATGEVEARLVLGDGLQYRDLLGWLDGRTVAFVVDGHLLAWRPDEDRVLRVTRMPERGLFTQDLAAAPGYY